MKKTLLCHFYNEEYLLPWFLKHHRQIFDHGIMIDYHSTDQSVAIIKELCPTWEIITSRNHDFQADNVDSEVRDIEAQIDGWRMCLNVTEFLAGDFSILSDQANQQLLIPTLVFVDCNSDVEISTSLPIYEQKTDGLSYHQHFHERRARSAHNMHIQYPVVGRHYDTYNTEQLVIFWYAWCPFNQSMLARRLQIQTQIPHQGAHGGGHHFTTVEHTLKHLHEELIPKCVSLQAEVDKHLAYYYKLQNNT